MNRLGDLKIHLDGPLGHPEPFHRRIYDINKSEYMYMYFKMRTAHYLNGPPNIDRTTQPSSIGGPLGNQKFQLISHTGYFHLFS